MQTVIVNGVIAVLTAAYNRREVLDC